MRIPRLIVHEYLQGLGIPGLAGLALLLVAVAWALGGLLPGWQSLQHLSQQTQEASEYLAKVEDGSIAPPVVPQRQLDDFRNKLPAQPQATVAIDRIYALAAQEHITLARRIRARCRPENPSGALSDPSAGARQLPATAPVCARLARSIAGCGGGRP